MKSASVQQLPEQWPEILRRVAQGEEVQVTQQDKVVARVVPAKPASQPDFLSRAKAISQPSHRLRGFATKIALASIWHRATRHGYENKMPKTEANEV
jgi:antitoxin (DNA-binding transcriptional repressor) of toxin-antitoxin stability system